MQYHIPENQYKSSRLNSLLAKLLTLMFVLICLAVGVVGLILPIIPGLLFLAIAARHSPSLDRWLRKNRLLRGYLDSGEGFLNLSWPGKIQFVIWLCLKIFIDTIVLIFALIANLLTFSVKKYQSYR